MIMCSIQKAIATLCILEEMIVCFEFCFASALHALMFNRTIVCSIYNKLQRHSNRKHYFNQFYSLRFCKEILENSFNWNAFFNFCTELVKWSCRLDWLHRNTLNCISHVFANHYNVKSKHFFLCKNTMLILFVL